MLGAIKSKIRWLLLDIGRVLTSFVCKRLHVKDRVLFYTERSQDSLMDNLKCVYDLVGVPKVICANKLAHPAVKKPMIYYYLYTSKVIISDDYIRYLRVIKLREEQKVIQLWHGGGMFKKICLDAPLRMSYEEERSAHIQYDALVVSSKECIPVYAKAFGVSEDIILPYGMPRTDDLVNEEKREKLRESFYENHPELKNKKIVSYFPTFREKDGKRIKLDTGIDFEALEKSLNEDEAFVIHRHPMVDYRLTETDSDKIIDLTSSPSVQLYCVSSVIVTDYSSVVFDACLLDVAFVFYCPDMESYDRDFYINPETDLPGKVTQESTQLISAMRAALDNPDKDKVKQFREFHMSACDGKASERAAKLTEDFYRS